MKTLPITLSSVLCLGLAALMVCGLVAAPSASATGSASFDLISGSVTMKADGSFDYVLLGKWNTAPKSPLLGKVILLGSYGVQPGTLQVKTGDGQNALELFQISGSTGEVMIKVTGKKVAGTRPWVGLRFQVGPPPADASADQYQSIP